MRSLEFRSLTWLLPQPKMSADWQWKLEFRPLERLRPVRQRRLRQVASAGKRVKYECIDEIPPQTFL